MAYVMNFKDPDFLYSTVNIAIWSDTEQGLAITAGSLATFRPLFRLLGSHFGFNTTSESKAVGMRAPQWNGAPRSNDSHKKSLFSTLTSSLFSTEKGTVRGTVREQDDEYGMGDLQPMRLRDDLVDETVDEKSKKMFNTWDIRAAEISDEEECRAGTITMQHEIVQQSERL